MLFFYFQAEGDQAQTVDVNPGLIFQKIDSWVDGFVKLLPNIGVALVFVIIGYYLARFVGDFVTGRFDKRDRSNLGKILGGLIKWSLILVVFLLAMTIVIPSINPGDLIAGLGVSSVAIGFAFKDILQNWLAGLLILIRQPFEIGDQIIVNGYEGTVKRIETRATIINTYNNENIVVPNNEIYTNSVQVKTAHDITRQQYDVGIGYADDIDLAIKTIKEAMKDVEGLDSSHEVEVLPWGLDASWVTLRLRWWTHSDRASVVKTYVDVIQKIKLALDAEAIDMPYNTYVHLWHDQTEEADGDRSSQREGWPLPKNTKKTTPRWKARKKELENTEA